MSKKNLLAILATKNINAVAANNEDTVNANNIVNTEDTNMNNNSTTANKAGFFSQTGEKALNLKPGFRYYTDEGGTFISNSILSCQPPVMFRENQVLAYIYNDRTQSGSYKVFNNEHEAHAAMGLFSVWMSQIEIMGQGIVALSQHVFFTDTTPAHGEFRELIETVMTRAQEIMNAPVTSMRGVDPRVVARRKFYVNDYLNTEARPKKAVEWCSEIEDLTGKMLSALNWTFVQAWQYIEKTERAQLVWRQLDIHFMALATYFQDYATYSMNELTTGKIARIGLVPTSWDLREDNFEFGFETSGVQGQGYWQAYDKATCIKMWLAGTLDPDVLVRCNNAYAYAQLSPHRALPYRYKQYFRS